MQERKTAFFTALFDVFIMLSEGLVRLGSKLIKADFKIVDYQEYCIRKMKKRGLR